MGYIVVLVLFGIYLLMYNTKIGRKIIKYIIEIGNGF